MQPEARSKPGGMHRKEITKWKRWGKMKRELTDVKRVHIKLIQREGNEEYLKNALHVEIADLAAVVITETEDGKYGTIQVKHAKEFSLKEKETLARFMLNLAINDAMEAGGTVVRTPKEHVKKKAEEAGGKLVLEMPQPNPADKFLVVTNTAEEYGAAAVFYPDFQEKVAKRFDGDFYMLPSSIHEWIAAPDDGRGPKMLKEIVRVVNDTEVNPKNRMSYSVYKYDAGEGLLRKVM